MKLFSALVLVTVAGTTSCKTSHNGPNDAATMSGFSLGAGSQETVQTGVIEPALVCIVSDSTLPAYELEIFPTGFDPQRGTTISDVVRKVVQTGEEILIDGGQGLLTDNDLAVLFNGGELNAISMNSTDRQGSQLPGTDSKQPVYLGTLTVDSAAGRQVECH